ncbi:MAG TPA: glycosyltransferase [Nitrospirales bacterium]|nr:glycosyltransferase [Nitrospirales bacterium]
MNRLKVLISAYACEPEKGSEPGVGWNTVTHVAEHHQLWVLTRANNRPSIELALKSNPLPTVTFVYYDLPKWSVWWKRGGSGIQVYYYLWQIGIMPLARRLQQEIGFDLVHHVTFVRYWNPCFLALLPVPLLWGPVGGGESTPGDFHNGFSLRGRTMEAGRNMARWLGERDPFVRMTAAKSRLSLATTPQTAACLDRIGCKNYEVMSQCALNLEEMNLLWSDRPVLAQGERVIFLSLGNLLHWKGVHLALSALKQSGLRNVEFLIVGSGPERGRLEELTQRFGLTGMVVFCGRLSRREALQKIKSCHVLVHPSLHDSGSFVCLESMAAGKPVICLNHGGPSSIVTPETGIKIVPTDELQTIKDLAKAMVCLTKNNALRERMGQHARSRVIKEFTWERKAEQFHQHYLAVTQTSS